MVKIALQQVEEIPLAMLEVYNSLNRIPFSLKIGNYEITQSTIYARYLFEGTLIEFRFNEDNYILYEISLVMFEKGIVKNYPISKFKLNDKKFYTCAIDMPYSDLENSTPVKIIRDKNTICFSWAESDTSTEYFALTSNCIVGVTTDFYLQCFLLTEIIEEDVFQIFGFD